MTKRIMACTALVALTALAACSSSKNVRDEIETSVNRANIALDRFGDRPGIRAGGAQLSEGVFVAASPEQTSSASLLPRRLQRADAVSLMSRDSLSLSAISQRLTEITNVSHVAALGPTGRIAQSPNEAADPTQLTTVVPGRTPVATAEAGGAPAPIRAAGGGSEAANISVRPNYSGRLSDVLDEVSNAFEVEWSFEEGRVIFRDYITRQYQLSALPSSTESSSNVGGTVSESASTLSTDLIEETTSALKGIVGNGATVSVGNGTGLVTVTARIADQQRIEDYIRELNGSIGQQIAFDVNVLTISLSNTNAYGIDLAAALQGGNIGDESFSLSGPATGISGAGSVNIGVIDGDLRLNSVAQALSTEGEVTVSTRAGATTSNNRVVPIEVTDQVAYVSEIPIEGDDTEFSRARSGIATDVVETGFSLQVFPRVLNNREIMVQYTVSLSELQNLRTFSSGDNRVQLPEVSNTSFEQQAVLENGQTLILAGFERTRAQTDEEGVGRAGFLGLGGSRRAEKERVATVLTITPRLIARRTAVRSGQ